MQLRVRYNNNHFHGDSISSTGSSTPPDSSPVSDGNEIAPEFIIGTAEAISIMLHEANIPCSFIGEVALRSYGISVLKSVTSCVIPNALTTKTLTTLLENGLEPCESGNECDWERDPISNMTTSPVYHFHLQPSSDSHFRESLRFYQQSDILGILPDPPLSVGDGDQNYMTVTDARLPDGDGDVGRWPDYSFPVCIPTVPRFLEAMMEQVGGGKDVGGRFTSCRADMVELVRYIRENPDNELIGSGEEVLRRIKSLCEV